jgi:hypothetical protein
MGVHNIPGQLAAFLVAPMRATFLADLTLLHLASVKFDEENRLWTSSLNSFICPPVISLLLVPNILLYSLFSNTLSLSSFLVFVILIGYLKQGGKIHSESETDVCHAHNFQDASSSHHGPSST